MRNNPERARKSSKRAHLWIFTTLFKFRTFRMLHPPKQHVFLEFLVDKKAFHFSKRTLRAVAICNNWLKQALTCKMTKHIQSPGIVRTLYKHFQEYLGKFRDTGMQISGEEGRSLLPFFENWKVCSGFGEKKPRLWPFSG